jgi:hypothetical protein
MPTSFESLPAELRNRIYELPHEVEVHACGNRTKELRDGVVATKGQDRVPGWMPGRFRAHEGGKYSCCLYMHEMTKVQMSLWVNRCSDVAKEGSLKPHPVKNVKARRVAVRVTRNKPMHGRTCVLTPSYRSSTAKLPTALRLASHGHSASTCRLSHRPLSLRSANWSAKILCQCVSSLQDVDSEANLTRSLKSSLRQSVVSLHDL